jgi:hypothetical protein
MAQTVYAVADVVNCRLRAQSQLAVPVNHYDLLRRKRGEAGCSIYQAGLFEWVYSGLPKLPQCRHRKYMLIMLNAV